MKTSYSGDPTSRLRYAELLTQFKTINSIPILLDPENNFRITLRDLRREVVGRGLGALLLSAGQHFGTRSVQFLRRIGVAFGGIR